MTIADWLLSLYRFSRTSHLDYLLNSSSDYVFSIGLLDAGKLALSINSENPQIFRISHHLLVLFSLYSLHCYSLHHSHSRFLSLPPSFHPTSTPFQYFNSFKSSFFFLKKFLAIFILFKNKFFFLKFVTIKLRSLCLLSKEGIFFHIDKIRFSKLLFFLPLIYYQPLSNSFTIFFPNAVE